MRIQIGHIGLEDRLAERLGLPAIESEPKAEEKLVEIGETLQKLIDNDTSQADAQKDIESEQDQQDNDAGKESSDE